MPPFVERNEEAPAITVGVGASNVVEMNMSTPIQYTD
jgi:hypothetical protein